MATYFEFIWAPSVLAKLAARGLSADDVESVVCAPFSEGESHSSGLPVAFGWIAEGRCIIGVYDEIDFMTVQVIAAYEVQEPRL